MSSRRWTGPVLLTVGLLVAACGGSDDGEAAPETTATTVASTTVATTTVATTSTSPPSSASPTTGASPATTAEVTTTIGETGGAGPADVTACSLLDEADIEQVLGGPVSEPVDLETSCEWEVGEGGIVPDTLTLTIEGPADGLEITRELLGDDALDVPQAGDGGVYWSAFTTLFFTTGGRELSLQFLAAEADDPLGGLVALANRVG
jgi:ribosomal protein S28E/S33